MRIRPYTSSDLDALRRMHASQGFDYPFPDLDDPIFISKLVLEDDEGRPVMAALARLTCEMYLLIDREAPVRHSERSDRTSVDRPAGTSGHAAEESHLGSVSSVTPPSAAEEQTAISVNEPKTTPLGAPLFAPSAKGGSCSGSPAVFSSVEAQGLPVRQAGFSPTKNDGASAPFLSAPDPQHAVELGSSSPGAEFAEPVVEQPADQTIGRHASLLPLGARAGNRRLARERWAQLLALHRAAELDLFARGLDDAHAWLPPQIAKRFGRRLESLGWLRDDSWTPYCKILKPGG